MSDPSKTQHEQDERQGGANVGRRSEGNLPRWIPRWMGELERAALIIAIAIVIGAIIIAVKIHGLRG